VFTKDSIRARWLTPVIQALRKLRQEGKECEVSLSYIARPFIEKEREREREH
jgi:hypothetical protein